MNILVTGAAGFVGGNVVRALLQEGHTVRAMVHKNRAALDGLDVEEVQADVLKPETLVPALSGVDAVIHTVAVVSIDGDPDGRVMKTNVTGVRNMVEASLQVAVKRFVHFSSVHAFREEGLDVVNEQAPPADERSFKYDQSKQGGEQEIRKGIEKGLNAVILNPTAIYGPFDFYPSFSGQMLLDFFHGKIPMLTPGGFNFIDVRDVAQVAIKALTKGKTGENFLLGNRWIAVKEMAAMTASVSGTPAPKFTSPAALAWIGLPFIRLGSLISGKPPLYTKESLHILSLGKNIDDNKAVSELGLNKIEPIETVRDAYEWFHKAGLLKAPLV